MNKPQWVNDLVAQVVKDYQCQKSLTINWRRTHKRKRETITWQGENIQTFRDKPFESSGHCHSEEISITAGKSRKDQKLVLLHELAHWLMPTGEHHGKAFWDLAFELYRKYGIPMYYALRREDEWKKAKMAYRRNRKKQ